MVPLFTTPKDYSLCPSFAIIFFVILLLTFLIVYGVGGHEAFRRDSSPGQGLVRVGSSAGQELVRNDSACREGSSGFGLACRLERYRLGVSNGFEMARFVRVRKVWTKRIVSHCLPGEI
jgi:hypothetical protein